MQKEQGYMKNNLRLRTLCHQVNKNYAISTMKWQSSPKPMPADISVSRELVKEVEKLGLFEKDKDYEITLNWIHILGDVKNGAT